MDHSRSPSRLPSCASFSVLEEDGPLKRTISWSCATSADNLTFSLTLSASQVRRLSPHQSTATLAATGPRRPYRRRHRPRHHPHRHHPHHAFTTALTTTAIAANRSHHQQHRLSLRATADRPSHPHASQHQNMHLANCLSSIPLTEAQAQVESRTGEATGRRAPGPPPRATPRVTEAGQRLAGARGSLRRALALSEASGVPAGRGPSQVRLGFLPARPGRPAPPLRRTYQVGRPGSPYWYLPYWYLYCHTGTPKYPPYTRWAAPARHANRAARVVAHCLPDDRTVR